MDTDGGTVRGEKWSALGAEVGARSCISDPPERGMESEVCTSSQDTDLWGKQRDTTCEETELKTARITDIPAQCKLEKLQEQLRG